MPSVIAPRSGRIARNIRAALVTVLLASASGGILAAIEPDRGVLAAFSAMLTHIAGLRNDEAPVPTDGLLKTIGAARGAYSRGDVCRAAALLDGFLTPADHIASCRDPRIGMDSRGGGVVPIGRAIARGGVARLAIVETPEPDRPINVFATKANAIGRSFSVNAPRQPGERSFEMAGHACDIIEPAP